MRLDAHNYRRRIERCFEQLENNRSVSKEDKEILRKYRDYLVSEGITYGRVGKYFTDLKKASELLGKSFSNADETDIRRIISIYDNTEKYSPCSKRDFKIAIRKFYTWMRGMKEYCKCQALFPPPEVAWIKVYGRVNNAKTHEDMLTEEEVKRLIEFASTVQDRAIISTLYESGCRIGELIYLKINQLNLTITERSFS